MARFRRRHGRRSYARMSSGRRSRRSSRRGSSTGNIMTRVVGAAVYGAGREKISQVIAPYTSMIPAGEYSDEIGMGLLAYAVGRFFPAAKPVTDAAITIEAARIGATLAGSMGATSTSTSAIKYG